MNNLSNTSETYSLLKKGLDASSLRSKITANNIANINTKGYKKYSVSFEENLNKSIDSLDLKTTDEKHIGDITENSDISIQQDKSTSLRQDGNNVDIDNEMANQAANQLMYNALISQVNSRLSLERYVVNGGK